MSLLNKHLSALSPLWGLDPLEAEITYCKADGTINIRLEFPRDMVVDLETDIDEEPENTGYYISVMVMEEIIVTGLMTLDDIVDSLSRTLKRINEEVICSHT
jgi:hypothetical protein